MKKQSQKIRRISDIFILLNLVVIITITDSQTLFAQEINDEPDIDSTSVFVQDTKHFLEVGLGLLAAPFLLDGRDWTNTGITVGTTALLFTADKSVKDFTLRNQNSLNNAIFNFDNYYGNQYTVLLTWGIYGYGAFTGDVKIRKMGLHAMEAFVYSGAITGMLKVLIGRRRPYAGENQFFFKPLQFNDNNYKALPSGHTTVSFAVSTALAKSWDNTYWKVFWYGTASLVAGSRIYHNQHWLSDVFLGAMIGYTVGKYVVNFDSRELPQLFGKSFQPYLGPSSVGLYLYLN